MIKLCLLHFSIFAQSNPIDNQIRDTIELQKAISLLNTEIKEGNEIAKHKFTAILESSLRLKDTLAFFKVCYDIDYQYFTPKRLNQEGILFIKENQRLLGVEEIRFGDFYNILGNHYLSLGINIEALNYFFKSVEWYQKYQEQNTTIPLGNIADIYFYNKDFEKSLEYNQLALSYSLKLENEQDKLYNIIWDYFRIGSIYKELENNEKAALNFEKSLKAAREYKDNDLLFLSISKAIEFYSHVGKNEKCAKLINEGDIICADYKSCQFYMAFDFELEKNKHYLKTGQLDKAIVPENMHFNSPQEQTSFYWYSANYYALKKDIVKMKSYYDKLIEENEKTERVNRATIYSNIEEKFLNKKLRKENQALVDDIETSKQLNLYIGSTLLVIFSLLMLQFYNNRRYKKVNNLLEGKKKDLEESNEELERFMFIVSHDLKTPLSSIINFTGLLQKKLEQSGDEIVDKYMSFIKEGGLRLNNLITDTLEFSKQSKQEYKLEAIDLNDLLEEIEHSISSYIQEKNAKIIKSKSFPKILGHPSSLVVLFQNLIENGIKYNESDCPTIKIHTKENEEFYSIFIEDNGIGIEEEYQDNVFIMFKRLHNQNDYEGSGLGLSICKKIMRQMNGAIILNSKIGRGSIFEIKFPIHLMQLSD